MRVFSWVLLLVLVFSIGRAESQELIQQIDDTTYEFGGLILNAADRTIRFPAAVNLGQGWIEVVLCTPRGKVHESLLVTDVTPLTLQTALIVLGYTPRHQPGIPPAAPDSLYLYVDCANDSGGRLERVESWIRDVQADRPMTAMAWEFCGSPIYPTGELAAEFEQTLIATFQLAAVVINNRSSRRDDSRYQVNEAVVPPKGTPLQLLIRPHPLPGEER
ncbi:hypothetical protein JW992_11245 [candidate division KSB1 bacterium]|nr:hypothetical protein [candidate division KSB1 bacterium]